MTSTGNITVLIVEDYPAVAKMLGECASGSGCNILQATGISEALSLIDQADILFLDWKLSDGNAGPVLAEWIARRRGPLLVVTGVLGRQECEQLLIAGASHAIIKPITVELTLTLLRRYCLEVEAQRRAASLDEQIAELRKANKKLQYGLAATSVIALIGAGPQAGELIRLAISLF